MSAVINEPPVTEPEHDPSVPDINLLEDKFPDWFRQPKQTAGFAFLLSAVYFYFAILPIWHSDVWGHLAYGRLMWTTQTLPATEPLMPLSQGIPFFDTAWLSQLIGYGGFLFGGRAALKFLYAASISGCCGFIAHRVYRRTHASWLAVVAVGLFIFVDYQQLRIMRPQVAGMVMFCGLLSLLTSHRLSKKAIWIAPVAMALWANLHGSFVVGIALLAAHTIGRAVDVLRRTGKLSAVWRDGRFRDLLMMTELGTVATLLNPYGLSIYTAVIDAANSPNMAGIFEWHALTLRSTQGKCVAAATALLMVLYRLTPRRVGSAEVLTLGGIGLAMAWSSRFVTWWGPLAAVYGCMHLGAVVRQWKNTDKTVAAEPIEPNRASFWTVLAIGLVWVSFAWSPIGMTTMRAITGKEAPKKDKYGSSVSDFTPEGIARHLKQNPPTGQIFNPYEWGDYLQWAGPKDLKVFVASHVQFVSPEVWEDYVSTIEQRSGWETQFDRYGINTVVLDERHRGPLIRRLLESEKWDRKYHDAQGSVLVRKKAI